MEALAALQYADRHRGADHHRPRAARGMVALGAEDQVTPSTPSWGRRDHRSRDLVEDEAEG